MRCLRRGDARAFIDERRQATRDDRLVVDRAGDDAETSALPGDDRVDGRIGNRRARASLVSIVSRSALPPQSPRRRQQRGNLRLTKRQAAARVTLSFRAQPDIQPSQIGDGERPHRETKGAQRAIHLRGHRTGFEEQLGLATIAKLHAIADEPAGVSDDDRRLPKRDGDGDGARDGALARRARADELDQAHRARRIEEVHS